jgi:serine phosphatase RsbU (regulator of sigma subunit)
MNRVLMKLNKFSLFLFILFPVLWPQGKAAGEVLVLKNTRNYLNIQNYFDYIEDLEGQWSFEDVMDGKTGFQWQKDGHGALNFGYTDSVVWIRGGLKNETGRDDDFMLEIAYPVIDDIRVFLLKKGGVYRLQLGDKVPFGDRPVFHRNFVIPLHLEEGESTEFFLRVKTTSSMQIPLSVYQEDGFAAKAQTDMLGYSLYYGAMMIMVIYNIFLFIIIRESSYFYYVFYVFSMTLWATSLNGFSFQYLWPNATVWNDQVIVFSLNGIVFFASMFAARFLNAREDWPKNYKVFRILSLTAFTMMVFSYVTPYRFGISSAMIIAVTTIFYGLVITVLRVIEGYGPAKIFLLAWAMLLGGGVIMALSKFGLLSRSFLTETAVQVGSVLEVTLLSFALAHRLNLEKKQRIEAQRVAHIHERHARIAKETELMNEKKVRSAREEAFEIQKIATETLERKVKERKDELNETLERVKKSHDKIMENLAYARMIQAAILPDPTDVSGIFKEHVILYLPRDIVGGDYYYIDRTERLAIVALADCTGHGVPGAFMTLVANWELKRIVSSEKCYDPGEILVKMNKRIRKALKQDTEKPFSDDGLDMAVCVLDREEKKLTYAGARIDLRYAAGSDVQTIKGDRRSLGYIALVGDYRFTVHHLPISPETIFYMVTDGIVDQPGGISRQRFGTRRLNDFISTYSQKPLAEQSERLKEMMTAYRGERDQVDDMTMVAFKAEFI